MCADRAQKVRELVEILSSYSPEVIEEALRLSLFRRPRPGTKIEKYVESLFLNTARVRWDSRGRHVYLVNTGVVVQYVFKYFLHDSDSAPLRGKIKRLAYKVRKRVAQRLRRMDEDKLHEFLATRDVRKGLVNLPPTL